MIGKEVRAWCSKEMKNLSVVFGGKERNFPKFHISSASLDTRDENVPPPPTFWWWCSTFNTNRLTYLCHWHWAVFVLGILRVVHRSIRHFDLIYFDVVFCVVNSKRLLDRRTKRRKFFWCCFFGHFQPFLHKENFFFSCTNTQQQQQQH